MNHLAVRMVNKDVPCAVVVQIGYLQPMGVADFSRLKGCIEGMDAHRCLRFLSLGTNEAGGDGEDGEREREKAR